MIHGENLEGNSESFEDEMLKVVVKKAMDDCFNLDDTAFAAFLSSKEAFVARLQEQYTDLELKKIKTYHALIGSGIDKFLDRGFGWEDKNKEQEMLAKIANFIFECRKQFSI